MKSRLKLRGEESSRPKRVTLPALILLALLLVAPACALSRLTASVDWRIVVTVPIAISVITFFMYRSDKRAAEAGEWRTPESTLHFADLIGGWPGGFLAQRQFRHKTSKSSFQAAFWIIVLIHQFVAVDSLLDWQVTKEVSGFIRTQMDHHSRTR